MFKGRTLLIATKHKKELVIAPLLEKELGVKCIVPKTFDTDLFGTFSGEIPREKDPITTIREKALAALDEENCDLVVASEGSFGSHPQAFYIPADDEFIILIDKKNQLEILARELSTDTNFHSGIIKDEAQLISFLEQIEFPNHGVIIKANQTKVGTIYKGITDHKILLNHFNQIVQENGSAFIETDMRAMFNPTRMKIIEKATEKLLKKIHSQCPKCKTPGFDITEVKKGLPCEYCGLPTNSTLSYNYECKKCGFNNEKTFPHSKKTEDPTYCDFCNP